MTKILGTLGATNSNLHDNNHRAFVVKMLRSVKDRHNRTNTVAEIISAIMKPQNKLVLLDALTYSVINALDAGNKFLDAEEASSSPLPKVFVKKKKETSALEMKFKASIAASDIQLAKAPKLIAKAKELVMAKLTLETIMLGVPFGDWTYEMISEADETFGKFKAQMNPGQTIRDVFTADKLAKVFFP